MKIEELEPTLTAIKGGIGAVADTLVEVVANQTEATTEILDAIEKLKNMDVPEAAVTLLDDIQTSLSSVVTETGTVATQAKTLADIIPNPPSPEG